MTAKETGQYGNSIQEQSRWAKETDTELRKHLAPCNLQAAILTRGMAVAAKCQTWGMLGEWQGWSWWLLQLFLGVHRACLTLKAVVTLVLKGQRRYYLEVKILVMTETFTVSLAEGRRLVSSGDRDVLNTLFYSHSEEQPGQSLKEWGLWGRQGKYGLYCKIQETKWPLFKKSSTWQKMTGISVSTNTSRQQESAEVYLRALSHCHSRQTGRDVFVEMVHIFKLFFKRFTELLNFKNACEQYFFLYMWRVT